MLLCCFWLSLVQALNSLFSLILPPPLPPDNSLMHLLPRLNNISLRNAFRQQCTANKLQMERGSCIRSCRHKDSRCNRSCMACRQARHRSMDCTQSAPKMVQWQQEQSPEPNTIGLWVWPQPRPKRKRRRTEIDGGIRWDNSYSCFGTHQLEHFDTWVLITDTAEMQLWAPMPTRRGFYSRLQLDLWLE